MLQFSMVKWPSFKVILFPLLLNTQLEITIITVVLYFNKYLENFNVFFVCSMCIITGSMYFVLVFSNLKTNNTSPCGIPHEMTLLEHENQIFLDAFHEDGLLVTARLEIMLIYIYLQSV